MGAEGKFDLKLAPGYDPESAASAPSPKPVSSAVSGPAFAALGPSPTPAASSGGGSANAASAPSSWSSLVKNNCPDKGGASSLSGAGSSGRKGSNSSVCSAASSSDISLGSSLGPPAGARADKRGEGPPPDQGCGAGGGGVAIGGVGSEAQRQEPVVVLSSAAAAAEGGGCAAGADGAEDPAAAISMGLVSVSSPDVSSVSESPSKDAPSQRPLCSAANARLSVSSLLAAGAPMSSSASVPNLSSREASLMESFVRRAPNMSRTNATNNMNLSRSSSDNNTNTLGRNVLSTASESATSPRRLNA